MEIETILEKLIKAYELSRSENTLSHYKIAIKQFAVFCPKTKITEVEYSDIENWLFSLKKLKHSSLTVKKSAIKLFFKYCYEKGLIESNPAVFIKIPFQFTDDTTPKAFTTKEINLLRERLKNNLRDRAIFEFLYSTGTRVSELIKLNRDDLDLDENSRIMEIKNSKGNSDGEVFLTHDCLARVRIYLESRQDNHPALFVSRLNKRFTRQGVWKMFKKYLTEDISQSMTLHSLRHTLALQIAIRGGNINEVQIVLRHRSKESTKKYLILSDEIKKMKYDMYND